MQEKIKVVIADDNLEFAEIVREFLNNKPDIEVLEIAKDGEEALEVLNRLEPDVALLDIVMPKLDGIGVLEKLNAAPKKLKTTHHVMRRFTYFSRFLKEWSGASIMPLSSITRK